jgi:hypothetical protein
MSVDERTRDALRAAARGIEPDINAMLASVEATAHRQVAVRRALLGVGALLVVVITAVLAAMLAESRPSGQDFAPVDAPAGTSVFTFGEHDLCSWFAPIEIAGFLGSQYEWTNEAEELVEVPGSGPDECLWRLTSAVGAAPYEVHAWNAGSGTMLPARVVEYGGGRLATPGGTVIGHPALNAGVVVQSEGWGVYVFWVPPTDQYLALSLTQLTGAGEVRADSAGGSAAPQSRFFAFANQFVQRLGWVATGRDVSSDRVFDIRTDSLCTWFTRQDMDRILQAAQERVGTRMEMTGFAPEGWCTAENLPGSWGSSSTVIALERVPQARTADFNRHEQLADSITYGDLAGSSNPYATRATLDVEGHEDVSLRMSLEIWGRWGIPGADEVDRTELTALAMAVANELLTEMNWVGQ